MSFLPVMAHTQKMPASDQSPGQSSVWRAKVRPDWNRHEPTQPLEHRTNGSRDEVGTLEHLVHVSEREGVDNNGISRRTAWLAKNGPISNTYEESLASQPRAKASKPTPKELRISAQKELLIAHAELEEELQRLDREFPRKSRKSKSKSTRVERQLGPAWVMAPRGKYALEKQPSSTPPQPGQAPRDSATPGQERTGTAERRRSDTPFDASAWLDSHHQRQHVDIPFLPEATTIPEAYSDTGCNAYTPGLYPSTANAGAYSTSATWPHSTTGLCQYEASGSRAYSASNSGSYGAYSQSAPATQDRYVHGLQQADYNQAFLGVDYNQLTQEVNSNQAIPTLVLNYGQQADYSQTFVDASYNQQVGETTWGMQTYHPAATESTLLSPTHSTWLQQSDSAFSSHSYGQYPHY